MVIPPENHLHDDKGGERHQEIQFENKEVSLLNYRYARNRLGNTPLTPNFIYLPAETPIFLAISQEEIMKKKTVLTLMLVLFIL
ncbi:MAG: hypothetical protein OEY93_11510, partial [Anaerolineae bacterium]|nr:hypothetical protein [Anaerolineae bacterium]